MTRIAVIGSGISGLAVARLLSPHARLTLYEAGDHFGGHSDTVDLRLAGVRHGVDTGFLVFNERSYPRLTELLRELGVATAASHMGFSVQLPDSGLEWSGSSLDSVFAQRRNLLRPRFLGMLAQIVRFNRLASAAAASADAAASDVTLGDFLDRHRFGASFREAYLLPMLGCIWSCPTGQMLRYPLATMLRFCANHGLLQLRDRPQWMTVAGGSREYVRRIVQALPDARLRCPVRQVRRTAAGAVVSTDAGSEHVDEVIFACHTDQALALLADANGDERALLGAIRYQPNLAVLHTDSSVLPRRRRAWAAWNYEAAAGDGAGQRAVCLHYLINRLQPLPWRTPVIVSLNPVRPIDARHVYRRTGYSHPVFDAAAIAAQRRLPALQGQRHTWFCGAWTRHGFHEDGLMSGEAVAGALAERLGAQKEAA